MLPHTHAWSRKQKWLIAAGVLIVLAAFGTLVYVFEHYYRGPSDSILVGTWELQDGCIDCTNLITLEPNHIAIGFGDSIAGENQIEYRGRWYAGGQLIVIRYSDQERSVASYWKIIDIAPDMLRVRITGREVLLKRSDRKPPRASNQSLEPTAGRCEVHV